MWSQSSTLAGLPTCVPSRYLGDDALASFSVTDGWCAFALEHDWTHEFIYTWIIKEVGLPLI